MAVPVPKAVQEIHEKYLRAYDNLQPKEARFGECRKNIYSQLLDLCRRVNFWKEEVYKYKRSKGHPEIENMIKWAHGNLDEARRQRDILWGNHEFQYTRLVYLDAQQSVKSACRRYQFWLRKLNQCCIDNDMIAVYIMVRDNFFSESRSIEWLVYCRDSNGKLETRSYWDGTIPNIGEPNLRKNMQAFMDYLFNKYDSEKARAKKVKFIGDLKDLRYLAEFSWWQRYEGVFFVNTREIVMKDKLFPADYKIKSTQSGGVEHHPAL